MPQARRFKKEYFGGQPTIGTIIGFLIAYYYYVLHPDLPRKLAARRGMLYVFLYNKWYFDELYDAIFVQPLIRLAGVFWQTGDVTLIDGIPNGLAALTSGSFFAAR